MKKITAFIIVLCMVLSFCGCSADNNDALDLETKYYEYAQECIEKGDTETAIKALEEGVEKTGSEKLKELLNTLKDDNKDENQNGSVTENSSQSNTEGGQGNSSVDDSQSSDTSSKKEFHLPADLIRYMKMSVYDFYGYEATTNEYYAGGYLFYPPDCAYGICYNPENTTKPAAILGEVIQILPGKSTYTYNELKEIFGSSLSKYSYMEMDETYTCEVKVDGYTLIFDFTNPKKIKYFTLV